MKKKLLLILACLATVLGSALPAMADHSGTVLCSDGTRSCSHWGNGYSPLLFQNIEPATISTNGRDLAQDAGYFWQDNNFIQGWNPGAFGAYSSDACNGNWRLGAI